MGTPSLLASRSYDRIGLAYAWQQSRFYRSVDGGRSFGQLVLPAAGTVESVAEDQAGGVYVALLAVTGGGASSGGVFVSRDAGTTWSRVGAGTALDRGATAVMPLSDGRLLSVPEERRLIERAQAGDDRARERLVEANMRLVYSVARRYRCRSLTLDDLVQEGAIGLLLAIDRFDMSQGCRLATYATHWIRQSITRAVERYEPGEETVQPGALLWRQRRGLGDGHSVRRIVLGGARLLDDRGV